MSAVATWDAGDREVVELHVRVFRRTPQGKRAMWLVPVLFGLAVGVFVAVVRPAPAATRLLWGALWATFSAVVFITMFRRSLRRRLAPFVKSLRGGEPRMRYRLAVDDEGLDSRQGTFEKRYRWDEVTGVEDTGAHLMLLFADGRFAAVPPTAFADDDARQAFVETVRAHHAF